MPRGIPNVPKGKPSSATEQLLQAMQELEERLEVERARDRQRSRLRTLLAKLPLLTKKDATAIVVETLQSGGKAGKAVTSKHAALATRRLRTQKLKPAKGQVGKAIRAARLKVGMSTTALGAIIGGGSGTISSYETGGAIPSAEKRVKLAKALGGLPPSLFVNGDARHSST